MRRNPLAFRGLGLIAWAAVTLAIGCSTGLTPSSPTTGSVSGRAYFPGLTDNSGILISAESSTDGKTVGVRSLEGATPGAAGAISARAIAAQATTTSSGSYTLSDLPAGTYTIYASSKDSLEKAVTTNVTVTAGNKAIASDLNLTPTGSISGTAKIGTTGALGIIVYIAGTSYAAITDSAGAYAISSVPVGSNYTLYAEKGDYTATATVSVAAGTVTAQNLTLSAALKDGDSKLASLGATAGSLSPAFSPATTSYRLWVGATSRVSVSPTADSAKAAVTLSQDQPMALLDGMNNLTITVTAEDGTSTVYSIGIIKGDYVGIASPSNDSSIATSSLTASGYWYSSIIPTLTMSFGGSPNVQATVNPDNTWTATIDASAVPNGANKQFHLYATYGSGTNSTFYNTSDIAYSGSSQSIATHTVSGTVSLPSAATLVPGQYLWIEIDANGIDSPVATLDIPLTGATSYQYSLAGIPDGTYWIWSATHDAAWSQTSRYVYNNGPGFTVSNANASYDFSVSNLE